MDTKELLEAEARKHARRTEGRAAANAAALPGPLREAFAGEPRRVSARVDGALVEHTLKPVTAGLEAVLTRIDSPLLPTFGVILSHRGRPEAEIRKELNKRIKPNAEAIPETVFCFIKAPAELRAILDKGRVAFREAAMGELGDRMGAVDMARMYEVCSEHYAAAFLTAISHQAAPPEDGTVFTKPLAGPVTGSAGGSNLCA